MKLRTSRILVAGYFVLMLVFVTWPGMVPFARIHPLVLGLPFSFAWIALWVAGSILVLWAADRVEARYRGGGPAAGGAGAGGAGTRGQDAGRAGRSDPDGGGPAADGAADTRKAGNPGSTGPAGRGEAR